MNKSLSEYHPAVSNWVRIVSKSLLDAGQRSWLEEIRKQAIIHNAELVDDGSFTYRLVFDTPRDMTMFILKYSGDINEQNNP